MEQRVQFPQCLGNIASSRVYKVQYANIIVILICQYLTDLPGSAYVEKKEEKCCTPHSYCQAQSPSEQIDAQNVYRVYWKTMNGNKKHHVKTAKIRLLNLAVKPSFSAVYADSLKEGTCAVFPLS